MLGRVSGLVLFSAAVEAITGLVVIAAPAFAGWLLLGISFSEITSGVARLAGVALLALAVAFTPRQHGSKSPALRGPLVYNALAGLYFIYWWAAFRTAGPLLWIAVALHVILAALFAAAASMHVADT